MRDVTLAADLTMHVEDDDFGDPWESREVVLLVHGFAESSRIWFGWVPHLARRYRVLRPDLRGFGQSSIPPDAAHYPWSPEGFAEDLGRLLDVLGVPRVHVVGARLGGPIGINLAVRRPELVQTLSIISGLARSGNVSGLALASDGTTVGFDDFAANIEQRGMRGWIAETGRARLGSDASDEKVAWWNDLMAASDQDVCIGMMVAASRLDVSDLLPRVGAPTLVVAGDSSTIQSLEVTRDWQSRIPSSELHVVAGDSPHLAATHPDYCAERVLEFVARHSADLACT